MLDESLKNEIIEQLRPLNPYKMIVFGSHAYGCPNKYSDIDLYVVTNDDFIPKNFSEKINIKLKFAERLRKIREQVDIDLIVHTKPMQTKFLEMGSLFSKKIHTDGQVIYESSN